MPRNREPALHCGAKNTNDKRKYNPLDYPEFVEAAKNNESGTLVYWYETEQAGGRYVHLCYRWVALSCRKCAREYRIIWYEWVKMVFALL